MYGLKPVPFSKDGWPALLRNGGAPLAGLVQERKDPLKPKPGLNGAPKALREYRAEIEQDTARREALR